MPKPNTTPAISIHQLWPTDHDDLREHLLRLTPKARRLRFTAAVNDDFINQYVDNIGQWDSLVYGAFIHGELRAAAELRGLLDQWPAKAEAAFSVEDEWQNRGIGDALLRRVIAAAKNRGVRSLYMICLSQNSRMQHLAQKHQAELSFEFGEVEAQLDTPWPTTGSIAEELIDEAESFITAIFEWPHKHIHKKTG